MDTTYSTTAADAGSAVFMTIFYLCCCLIYLPFIVFQIWMIVDAAKRKYPAEKDNEKVIWLLVVILGQWIGSVVYYFVVKRPYDKAKTAVAAQPETVPAQVVEATPVEAEPKNE
jgi:prolipoprotein diacylglyceryltransferase